MGWGLRPTLFSYRPTTREPPPLMRLRLLLLSVILTCDHGLASTEKRFALVIGNDQYENVRPLNNPVNDASSVGAVLREMDFSVTLRTDANLRSMKDALRTFIDEISDEPAEKRVALVYFAGHGVQIAGKNYLIPTDAAMSRDYEVPDETLSMETVIRALESTEAKLSLLVLDCCRNNPFSRSWRGVRNTSEGGGLAMPTSAPQGLFIAFATSPGTVAADGQGNNSPYTTALIEHLPTSGIPFEEVFKKVGGDVAQSSNGAQQPWFNSKFYGQFYFEPKEESGESSSSDEPMTASEDNSESEGPLVNSIGQEFLPIPGKEKILMSRTETRLRDFRAFVEDTGYDQEGGAWTFQLQKKETGAYITDWLHDPNASWEHTGYAGQGEDHPVVCVSWEEANAFCQWLSEKENRNYRLPTDAEWSAAAGTRKYPWGTAFPPPAGSGNFWDRDAVKDLPGDWIDTVFSGHAYIDGGVRTIATASYQPNEHGFFDMGGNVWEWCSNIYHPSMNEPEVLEAMPEMKETTAPDGKAYRVLRGSSWNNYSEMTLRTSFRDFDSEDRRDDDYGFRVVLDLR